MIDVLEECGPMRRVAEVLFARGWAEANAGNISLRLGEVPGTLAGRSPSPASIHESTVDMADLVGDFFLITASGSRMREIASDPRQGLCLVQVLDRRRMWLIDGPGPVSSEWATHAGLHTLFKESRCNERAVIHCHPLGLIALSHLFASEKEMNDRLSRMQHETRLFLPQMIGLIPYAVTGSKELAKASKEKLKRFRVALWDKHGVIASGRTLDEALDRIEVAEKAASVYLLLKSAGVEAEGLGDEQIAETLRAFKK
ncbi:MAG: rhamnulose-1-phosphate aldolase [Candidatus Aminicenantes bacterium]|nr:rhamnulose-1-phosphate aldolase [Candidatus Aminicenantes bacterium]